MIPLLDLQKQYLSIKPEIDQAIQKVVTQGDFILGTEVALFEQELANYIGVKEAIGVSSGYSALTLSLSALGVGEGDEVVTSANTFIATILGALHLGAKVRLVDVDPETFNLDPKLLEKTITKRTKVIIPVHLYGRPCDMGAILKLAQKYKVRVLEDSAQAQGAKFHGKKVGSFGQLSAFSFYPGKNLGAYGDAGAVVTDDPKLAEKIRILRNVGQKSKYHHIVRGYNDRLDTLQAAVLRVKLKYLDSWNQKRVQVANWYREFLQDTNLVLPTTTEGHVWHQFAVQVSNRKEVQEHLHQKGVATGIHYPLPLHLQIALKDLGYRKGDFPVTEKLCAKVLSLPMDPGLTKGEVKFISESVKEVA